VLLIARRLNLSRISTKKPPNGQAEIGTLVIDIIDPGSKTVIWRGWGRADVNRTPAQTEQLIQTIVAAILGNFPDRT
jgi:hypothetical protein